MATSSAASISRTTLFAAYSALLQHRCETLKGNGPAVYGRRANTHARHANRHVRPLVAPIDFQTDRYQCNDGILPIYAQRTFLRDGITRFVINFRTALARAVINVHPLKRFNPRLQRQTRQSTNPSIARISIFLPMYRQFTKLDCVQT